MMDGQMMTPPPAPRKQVSYGKKVFLMALMCCVLMFGVLAVWLMAYSRDQNNREVANDIVYQWGGKVLIEGPTAKAYAESEREVRPATFNCRSEVATQSLHRGIYEAEVFTANVSMSGSFSRDSLAQLGDMVVVQLDVPASNIVKAGVLDIGGKKATWNKTEEHLLAHVALSGMPETIEWKTDLEVRGSGGLFINQIGEASKITINGEAANPSYDGESLPIDRDSHGRRFRAVWENSMSGGIDRTDLPGVVGANFLVGVDRYQKVERSLKYSFMIIILTFISVLFVEIMRRQPIPLLNYFLIGAALILFYSLLLSFVELIPFGWAYLVAATMTIALITCYLWKMLQSRKLGLSVGAILSLIYIFCYIMLNASTYALLSGSLLLFISLAAMMYASLKIKR